MLHDKDREPASYSFGDELKFMRRVIRVGVGLTHRRGQPKSFQVRGNVLLPVKTLHLVSACHDKSTRQFRAIIELCRLALPDESDVMLRALYELMLTNEFLLRPGIKLKMTCKRNGKNPGEKRTYVTRVDNLQATTYEARANLYIAKAIFDRKKDLVRRSETRGLRSTAHRRALAKAEADANGAEAIVGKKWADRLRKGGFSGRSVVDLAASFGFLKVHHALYARWSANSHGSDLLKRISSTSEQATELDYERFMEDLLLVMNLSSRVYLTLIGTLAETLCLRQSARVQAMQGEHDSIFR